MEHVVEVFVVGIHGCALVVWSVLAREMRERSLKSADLVAVYWCFVGFKDAVDGELRPSLGK
jgi:heme/copper-type cytochrome/quinol oxidase subunit 3